VSESACPSEQELIAFQIGVLADADVDRIAAHLETCPRCEALLDDVDGRTDPLLYALRQPPAAPDTGTDRTPHLHAGADDIARMLARLPSLTPATPSGPDGLPRVPGYEILGELGRGGMGVVYQARDVRLNRPVAVKWLHAGGVEELLRFRIEAEAVARLAHPNIVQIYEIGEEQGRPYLVLELVEGGSLEQFAGRPLPARAAAALVETLARAIHHAHERGIIHRDLKPANILLPSRRASILACPGDGGQAGCLPYEPKITDFGVAKRLGASSGATQTGDVLGTPGYMAPEQAAGRNDLLGPATDVYALGVILYELLTGRPPLKGPGPLETLLLVRAKEPVSPRRLVPQIPRDLETICLKCLHKEPVRRYATALDLAEDLRRFLDGEPIRAKPVGPVERGVKWARRHPTAAALVATLAFVALVGFPALTFLYLRAETQSRLADQARRDAQTALIETYVSNGLTAAGQHDPAGSLLWFAEAARLPGNDPERRRLSLVRARNWLRHVCLPAGALAHDRNRAPDLLAFHPAGRYLLLMFPDQVSLWDVESESRVTLPGPERGVTGAAWSPDGRLLALASEGTVGLYTVPGWKEVRRMDAGGSVLAVRFSADSRYLAVGTGKGARVWDCRREAFAGPELAHPDAVVGVQVNGRGDRLATACADGRLRVFALSGADTGRPLFDPVPFRQGSNDPLQTFIEDRGLLTWSDDTQIIWREAETGKVVRTIACDATGTPRALRVIHSGDGRYFAVVWGGQAQVWDVRGKIRAHDVFRDAKDVSFDPTGRILLAVAGEQASVRFLTASGAPPPYDPLRQMGVTHRVYFSTAGLLATAEQRSGLVRLWKLPPGNPCLYEVAAGGSTRVALSPDGRHLMASGLNDPTGMLLATRVHEAATGRPAGPPLEPGGIILDAALSPDGRHAVTLSADTARPEQRDPARWRADARTGTVQVWDWRTGAPAFDPVRMLSEPRCVAWSPDGALLAVICSGGGNPPARCCQRPRCPPDEHGRPFLPLAPGLLSLQRRPLLQPRRPAAGELGSDARQAWLGRASLGRRCRRAPAPAAAARGPRLPGPFLAGRAVPGDGGGRRRPARPRLGHEDGPPRRTAAGARRHRLGGPVHRRRPAAADRLRRRLRQRVGLAGGAAGVPAVPPGV
jgi:WD40 repeat protein